MGLNPCGLISFRARSYCAHRDRLGEFCRTRGLHNLLRAIQAGETIPGDDGVFVPVTAKITGTTPSRFRARGARLLGTCVTPGRCIPIRRSTYSTAPVCLLRHSRRKTRDASRRSPSEGWRYLDYLHPGFDRRKPLRHRHGRRGRSTVDVESRDIKFQRAVRSQSAFQGDAFVEPRSGRFRLGRRIRLLARIGRHERCPV